MVASFNLPAPQHLHFVHAVAVHRELREVDVEGAQLRRCHLDIECPEVLPQWVDVALAWILAKKPFRPPAPPSMSNPNFVAIRTLSRTGASRFADKRLVRVGSIHFRSSWNESMPSTDPTGARIPEPTRLLATPKQSLSWASRGRLGKSAGRQPAS